MVRRFSLLFVAALLVAEAALATGVSAAARVPAQAGPESLHHERSRPPAPLGGYRPHFVHQGLNNCAFASAEMLVDKWTGGDRRPPQERLREASGVPNTEGVGISQLARAVERVTRIDIRWSPGGGDPLTWDALMLRLARGGAAVVSGSYSDLPSHFNRWGRDYAALGPSLSGHAVYVERFERTRRGGRVWVMDPLASGAGYRGEWMPANTLKAFVWRARNGLVHAMATPEPPPLAGYEFGAAAVSNANSALAGREVTFQLPLTVRSGWDAPNNLALAVTWQAESLDPDPAAVADAYAAEVAAARAAAIEEEARLRRSADGREDADADEPADPSFDEQGVAGPGRTGQTIDRSAEDLAAWRAAQAAEAADDALAGEAPAGEQPDGAEQPPNGEQAADVPPLPAPEQALVSLEPRGDSLVGTTRAPGAAGTYRVSVELRHRDGSRFADPPAPALEGFTIRLRGAFEASYAEVAAPAHLEQGSLATVSLKVTNMGSADWHAESSAKLVATWQTSIGSWHAGTAAVDLGSLESGRFAVDVIVPTQVTEGSLSLELLTVDGIPYAMFGLQPTTLTMGFTPRAPDPAEITQPHE